MRTGYKIPTEMDFQSERALYNILEPRQVKFVHRCATVTERTFVHSVICGPQLVAFSNKDLEPVAELEVPLFGA